LSILYLTKKRKRVQKDIGTLIAVFMMFTLLMATCFPGTARAVGANDIVAEVANRNLQSPTFTSDTEPVSGGSFKFYDVLGDLSSGWASLSICEPVGATGIQAVVNWETTNQQKYGIEVKTLNTSAGQGYQVREYTDSDTVGIWYVYPKYFIQVEIIETGNSTDIDMQTARGLAGQLIDGLQKNGLLNTAAESASPAGGAASSAAAVVTAKALTEPVKVADTFNIAGVRNQPTAPTTFIINKPHLVTYITNYHWNNAKGISPGQIGFKDQNGKVYGPWQASGRPGQGGVPNAYWEVSPNIVIPAGTYTLTDSDPATWSQNSQSGGKGMSEVKATPNFEVTNDSGKSSGTGAARTSESPAGVGSVGNIPGPANTTEAVVGVVVPGLIATALGALSGLGGGGGLTPPGGTPLSPTGGGPAGTGSSGAGGPTGGPGNAQNSKIQEVGQIGRKRQEYDPAFVSIEPERSSLNNDDIMISVENGLIIDAEQEDNLRVQPESDLIIETSEEAAVLIQPDSGIIIDTAGEEAGVLIQPDSGIIIDTAGEEAGVLIQPDSGLIIETAEEEAGVLIQPGSGIIIDTAGEEAGVLSQPGQVGVPTAGGSDGGILIDTSALDMQEPTASVVNDGNVNPDKTDLTEEGYDENGLDSQGFDRNGYDQAGYDKDGYNVEGFDKNGFDRNGYDENGFDKSGYDKDGYNEEGFNREHFDREGFDKNGYNSQGYDREGFNQAGYDSEGYNKEGFNREGYNIEGYNAKGYDRQGFDHSGYDSSGYDRKGYNQEGYNREGYNAEGYNQDGYDRSGYDQAGFDKKGFNKDGYDKEGYDREGYRQDGYDEAGYDRKGYNKDGYNQEGYDRSGYNKDGFDKEGYDHSGYDREGMDKEGYDQNGYDRKGFNKEGFDQDGFDKNGFDAEGYGRNGFDKYGYDREGYDVNGYDEHGYNHSGYDAKGYNKSGYNKEGFDKDGWDKDGYGRNGLNKEGYDREGYDAKGFDKDGYNRDGYDRKGMQREGYDEDGYDNKGFNENGYDRDGFDREGFDYEGYNRGGYDPWGYDKQGYGKDGYHWSGYNAEGYNRDGRHWSENPFEGDGNPFNVATQDPFGEGEVIPFGAKWTPTKPKLGEPYPGTVEKYGAKPWTNDAKPEPETPSVPNSGTIGPEDPQNTLENHDPGLGKTPETPDESSIPQNIPEEDWPENRGDTQPEQEVETGNELEVPVDQHPAEADPNTFTVTDPETGEKTTYEYPEGYDGPRQGDTQILVGKNDGRPYELEFDAVKGKWINTESGNEFNPDDFDRWQNDLAEDKRRIAQDIEKMSQRQDANSKAIDKNLSDWQNLEQMQKAADKYNIGEPGGPGDMDKAIQDLKDDMLAGKEVDQDRMEQLKKIIGNRITGKTTGDSGERWEEDWFKKMGWALEANAATAKEVVTGEKADGSISWLGMGARVMITGLSGGVTLAGTIGSQVVMDGALTVAEAMYRIKDSIDKGESDFRAVSKALGILILSEEIGWLAGKAGGSLMKKMLERFPVFTNTAADLIEKGALIVMGGDQIVSHALRLVGREAAEEALDQINKRLVDLGSDTAVKVVNRGAKAVNLGVKSSLDNIAAGAGKAGSSGVDDLIKGTGKAASTSTDDIVKGGGKAASSSDDIAGGSVGKGAKAADGLDTPQKSPATGGDVPGGGDGPGDPGTPSSSGGDAGSTQDDIIIDRPLNTNARTPEEVLADPAAVARAENTVQNNVKDFDNLPPARQEELIREQAIYDEYKMQAQEKNYNLADKVQRGERINVDDVMEMKADPASMRTLKNLEHTEGIGAELGTTRSQQVQSEFNEVLETQIHQPSYRDVESHLSGRYNGAEVRCRTVRTPGTEDTSWNINTDNDVVAERLVNGPNGPEWVEIPKSEWEDVYHKSFAEHSGFNKETAACRFPDKNWAEMDDAACYKEWADLHEEAPMDVFDPMAARDFSNQRTAVLNGERPDGPLFDRNGNLLRDPIDSEQLGMMEKHKADDYWNKGDTSAEIMKNQTESLEQMRKTARVAQNIEGGTQNMPPNMQEAIRVINNNELSPALRAARLQELGYDTPGNFMDKVTSRIGSIRN